MFDSNTGILLLFILNLRKSQGFLQAQEVWGGFLYEGDKIKFSHLFFGWGGGGGCPRDFTRKPCFI